ncbi:hypothetical protein [Sphingomonas sp. GB1N7]|uniref:hypothetical protein n=1 Tax=Parasphingomonas caseinilytica TaxID=3096158 RepID=UPI002FC97B0A
MQWKGFVGGFVVAAVLAGFSGNRMIKAAEDQPAFWPMKAFYDDRDTRPDSGFVKVSGSLTGEDMKGNTYLNIECRRPTMTCRINELTQLHPPRSIFLWNDEFPIKSWADDLIVAESQPAAGACNRVRLVIVRASETAQYIRIPQPDADAAGCKMFDKKVFNWTIGSQFPNKQTD